MLEIRAKARRLKAREPKLGQNRMHFDLRAPGDIQEEVTRLTGLGAEVMRAGEELVVMRDPGGNEFCVE